MLSIPWAIFITFSIVFYTLFLENTISLTLVFILETSIGVFLIYWTYSIHKEYNKDLKKISTIMDKVKNGEELPSLEELMKEN